MKKNIRAANNLIFVLIYILGDKISYIFYIKNLICIFSPTSKWHLKKNSKFGQILKTTALKPIAFFDIFKGA